MCHYYSDNLFVDILLQQENYILVCLITDMVLLLTTEAKYIALTYTIKETILFYKFLSKLLSPIIFLLIIYNDNQSTVSSHTKFISFTTTIPWGEITLEVILY